MATIRNLLIRLGVDFSERGIKKAERAVARFEKRLVGVSRLAAGGAGLASLAGGATALSAALVPAAGALLVLPARLAATQAAAATLKVGLYGVGEAMSAAASKDAKALDEALKKLSPSARAFVRESTGISKSFRPIRAAVQERMFDGLAKQVRPIAGNLLPAVRRGMVGVAGGLNAGAREAAAFARTPLARGALAAVFATTERVTRRLSSAVQPALRGITSLTVNSLPLLERMAGWATNGAKAAGAFLSSERGATMLRNAVQRAGDTLAQLGRIAGNVGRFLAGVFRSAKGSGDGVLTTIEQVTAKMAAFSASVGGQQRMTEAFRLLLEILRAVTGVLPIFLGPLGAVLKIMTSLPEPVRGVAVQLLAFSVVAVALGGKLSFLFKTITSVSGAAITAGGAMIKFGSGLLRGGAALGENASAAARAGVAVRNFSVLAYQGMQTTSLLAVSMAKLAWEKGRAAAQAVLATTRTVAMTVAQKAAAVASRVFAVAIRLVNAAMRANPIGIVITLLIAIGGALVLAYKKSATFRAIVDGAFRAVGRVGSWLWNNALGPALKALRDFLVVTLAPKFLWFHNTIAAPTFRKIGQVISFVVNSMIRPVLSFLAKTVTQTIPNAFRTGVDAVKRFWDRLVDIAKAPVNFVIRFYNQGVGKLINQLAEFVGIKARLPGIPYFARGGVLPGYAPGRDTMLAAVSPGESIFRPEFTRAVGSGFVEQANQIARRGGPESVRRWLTGPDALGGEGLAFARGGIVPFAGRYAFGGIIGKFIQGVKDFTIGNVAKGARTLLDKVLGVIPGAGMIRDVIAGIPSWIKDSVVNWVKAKVGIDGGGTGGPGVQKALAFARAQAGKPYLWGGVGPGGYDCSGFISALVNVIKGRNPYSRLFTTFSFTGGNQGPQGFVRNLRSGMMVGVTNAGVGHMAGTLGGVNVESRGSAGVVVGPAARGFNNGLFPMRYGLKFDSGGVMPPGHGAYYNGTGKPEYVFTQRQMASMGGTIVIQKLELRFADDRNMYEKGREFAEGLREYKRRGGKLPTP
ncbi:hypothetical protein [Streptosporangium carneum]|uniref:NlpC/P60 domain-containing protein n=1 Tax=Streptosporangium carneum TaxID=47481 RepID=A0A9W6HVW8_9ACTN|nr:hypothetical protein [Streptosporangium carneum]GLK07320.1 hypothetical protein GCM10017600_07250 [Streptosporangium carneum]